MQAITDSKQTVKRADSLEAMLGWHTAAVFKAENHEDEDQQATPREIIVLTDPYPEYKRFVLSGDSLVFSSELTRETYEDVFEETIRNHGEATIVPLSELDCIQRNNRNIPKFTD